MTIFTPIKMMQAGLFKSTSFKNDHYGTMINANYSSLNNLELASGIHLYQFDRTNEESITPDFKNPYYKEMSTKKNSVGLLGQIGCKKVITKCRYTV